MIMSPRPGAPLRSGSSAIGEVCSALGELGGSAVGAASRQDYAGSKFTGRWAALISRLALEQRGGVLLGGDLGSTRLEISANPTGSTRLRVYGVTSGNRRVCHSAVWRVPPSTSLTTAGC